MDWDPAFLSRSPIFEPLHASKATFGAAWPDLDGLQRFLDARDLPVRNAAGLRLRVVPPARGAREPGNRYEARAFLRGDLEVRERCWHDLFNVLVWLVFPRAKAALNARHYEALGLQNTANRGPAQDALTLFDEGGVIVASSDEGLLEMLHAFRWKELFWQRREDVRSRMRFVVFGHALYEKALAPFTGITARGILLPAAQSLLEARAAELLAALDARLASWIEDPAMLSATRDLAPVPILGVPGWCEANEREEYYDNPGYFRPGRKARSGARDYAEETPENRTARFLPCDLLT